MKPSAVAELVLLAALWGASFLFMRVAAPEFGPVPLVGVRVAVAALCLAPMVWIAPKTPTAAPPAGARWRRYVWPAAVLGVTNSALPFCLFAYATLSVTGGFAAVLNATAPFFAAFVARAWLGERLSAARAAGLVVGFAGVVVLVWKSVSFKAGGSGWAVSAGLAASLLYGYSANYTKRRGGGLDPLPLAAGSQVAAALLLLGPAAWLLSTAPTPPTGRAWLAAAALGVLCTALAYVLYFRLLAAAGPTKAIAVTFLVPLFAMAWGFLFLGEGATPRMLAGMAMVLAGTGLTTGIIGGPRAARAAPPGQTRTGLQATTGWKSA